MSQNVFKVVFAVVLLYLIAVFVVPLIRQQNLPRKEVKNSPVPAAPSQEAIDMAKLGILHFTPGQAVLTVSQQKQLFDLMQALGQHSPVVLRIGGTYDPQSDKEALEARIFDRDYEQLRQESNANSAYQRMYQRRFGLRALWHLSRKYKKGIGRYDYEKLNAEIKRRLIGQMPLAQDTLNNLALARAKLVYQFLLVNGVDAKSMQLGSPQATQAGMGDVPLPLTLTDPDQH